MNKPYLKPPRQPTRLGRMIRKIIEWWAGCYYEGPRAPRRLAEEVRMFRAMNPHANAAQWEVFSAGLARSCYEQGFTRGHEWLQRDWPGPEYDPEVIAEIEGQDWSLAEENAAAREFMEAVDRKPDPYSRVPKADLPHYFHDAGIRHGTHRVIIIDDDTESG